MHSDIAPLTDDATPRPTSPPSGPMTRARVKALHDKVNSILTTLDLDTPLDGLLLHASALCVIRYQAHQGTEGEEGTPLTPQETEEGEEGSPSNGEGRPGPALPPPSGRHCRPEHPGTAGRISPALPAEAPRHCRPWSTGSAGHAGTAAPEAPALPASSTPPTSGPSI